MDKETLVLSMAPQIPASKGQFEGLEILTRYICTEGLMHNIDKHRILISLPEI